jgi:hypothetical protein
MPIGSWSAYVKVIQGMCATNPTSVLDLGIGFGMNGAAVRNWLDLGTKEANGGKWRIKLDGVEGFAKYKNPVWDVYDKVHVMDIRKFIEIEARYDLIIMTDVIEHFDKEEGIKILRRLKEMCNKAVIVSTPAIWIEQGDAYGNKYEAHRSMWNLHDFRAEGYGIVMDGSLDQYGHKMIVSDYIKK